QAFDSATGLPIAGENSTSTVRLTVEGVDDPIKIRSNGGGDNAYVTIAENQSAITTVFASDPDTVATPNYSITQGGSYFQIDAATGQLRLANLPPNFEPYSPTYDVTVTASDGRTSDSQIIHVTITDVNEYTPAFFGSNFFSVEENKTAIG